MKDYRTNKWTWAVVLLMISTFATPDAFAAIITKMSRKKGRVVIDEGSESGFLKGEKVCFYNDAGKKRACGRVVRSKPDTATVKVSRKRIRRLKKGMEATLESAGGGGGGAGGESVASGPSPKHHTNVKFVYVLGMGPMGYKKLSFQPYDAAEETMWKDNGDAGAEFNLTGFGAEGEFGIGSSMSMTAGFRYRLFNDFLGISDFDNSNADQFVETTVDASSIGLWSDFYFYEMGGGSLHFRFGGGLDIDMSTVTLSAVRKDDSGATEETTIVEATSSDTVLSLRLPISLNYSFGGPGMVFNLTPMIPVAEFGKSISSTIDTTTLTTPTEDEQLTDLETSLAHQKASFGLEIILGLYYAF